MQKQTRLINLGKKQALDERSKLMLKLATIFENNKEEYAQLATLEMGKVIAQSRKEIEKCALICRYYANNITKSY